MTRSSFRSLRLSGPLVLAAAAAIAILASAPALADTVTQTQSLEGGERTASVANLRLADLAYSHAVQTQSGSMTLTVDDLSGSEKGWNVTVQVSAFAYSGPNKGTAIPATSFALTSASTPVLAAIPDPGDAVDASAGPKVPAASPLGTLDTARKVVQSEVEHGNGTYTQALGVALTVPARSRAGTYTGTITTTVADGP